MRVKTVVLSMLAFCLITGCGQTVAPDVDTATTPPSPSSAPVDGSEACPAGTPVHLPEDVGPVSEAYLCGVETRTVEGDGEWSFSVVRRVTSGLAALLRAYASPDQTPGDPSAPAF